MPKAEAYCTICPHIPEAGPPRTRLPTPHPRILPAWRPRRPPPRCARGPAAVCAPLCAMRPHIWAFGRRRRRNISSADWPCCCRWWCCACRARTAWRAPGRPRMCSARTPARRSSPSRAPRPMTARESCGWSRSTRRACPAIRSPMPRRCGRGSIRMPR